MKPITKRKPRLAQVFIWSFLALTLTNGHLAYGEPTTPPAEPEAKVEESSQPQQGAVSKSQADTEEISDREKLRNEKIGRASEHFEAAHKYVAKGDLTLAEIEMLEAIAIAPEVKAYHRDYCLIAIAKLQPGLAAAEFMMATGLGDPIPYTAKEKEELDKKAAILHFNKGVNYGRKYRWIPAVAEFEKAINYNPQNANIRRSLAFAYGNEGRFDLAEKAYEESFGQMPEDAFSHADFAFMLNEHGQQQSALEQLAKAVELQPQSAALHVDLAWLSENKGDFKKAGDELREAIKLSPGHAALWSHLGRVLEREGNIPDAKSAYTKAIALDPGQEQAQESLKKLK